jgi:hypothetical protein
MRADEYPRRACRSDFMQARGGQGFQLDRESACGRYGLEG